MIEIQRVLSLEEQLAALARHDREERRKLEHLVNDAIHKMKRLRPEYRGTLLSEYIPESRG